MTTLKVITKAKEIDSVGQSYVTLVGPGEKVETVFGDQYPDQLYCTKMTAEVEIEAKFDVNLEDFYQRRNAESGTIFLVPKISD